ncbi:AbiV family abortive infection protein [Enterovibrio norvegicus]|uniref:AbiV family abortive infection protein n=1 Tax=Enterovibrio norvegicus TaxID=188144 RepID=UPI00352FC358
MHSDNELRQLSEKAYQNAGELLDESLLLFKADRFSRAYVLAHLATEELAKVPIIYATRVRMKGKEEIDWRHFKKRLTGHQAKLRSIALFDYMNDEVDLVRNEDVERYNKQLGFIKKYDLLKNMGLYSGYHENTVFKPSEQFDSELALYMIKLTEGRLKCLKSRWSGMISSDVTDNGYAAHKAISEILNAVENS